MEKLQDYTVATVRSALRSHLPAMREAEAAKATHDIIIDPTWKHSAVILESERRNIATFLRAIEDDTEITLSMWSAIHDVGRMAGLHAYASGIVAWGAQVLSASGHGWERIAEGTYLAGF